MGWINKAVIYTVMGLILILLLALQIQSDKISNLERDKADLNGQLSAQQVINSTTLTAVTTYHRVSLDNIKAKETEGTENVKIKTVIRTEFKDSECAVTPVSPGIVGKLQQYERDIRARAGGADSATTDR